MSDTTESFKKALLTDNNIPVESIMSLHVKGVSVKQMASRTIALGLIDESIDPEDTELNLQEFYNGFVAALSQIILQQNE